MQLTLNEQERAAYSAGDTTLAEALGARIDMQHALAADVVSIEELQSEIEHLKRILADALADDSWRERAQAAIAD